MESIIIQEFPADQRIKDLAKKYGYEEYMVARFAVLVPELEKFLVSMEAPPTVYIRVNTLKIAPNALLKRLSDKGFNLKQADLPDCFEVIEEPYSLGASAEHLLGYFYMQDKSSMIPPLALAPNPGEVVIDMAASPGGKTTHIAQLMNNEGLIIAIEKEVARLPSLRTNIGRCGVRNAAVYHMDALEAETIGLKADKILLDAPCTGEGVIARDRSRKTSRAETDIQFCSTLQHELIDAAMKVLKPGGTLVYSTCSYAPEEDEMVVDYAVKKYGLKVEPVPYGLPGIEKFGNLTFNPQVKNTRRLFPHLHSTTGFFVARMRYV